MFQPVAILWMIKKIVLTNFCKNKTKQKGDCVSQLSSVTLFFSSSSSSSSSSCRRQDELEAKIIEEELQKRVEEEMAKRVQQLLLERKDEIEAEVLRRVEEAKKVGSIGGLG